MSSSRLSTTAQTWRIGKPQLERSPSAGARLAAPPRALVLKRSRCAWYRRLLVRRMEQEQRNGMAFPGQQLEFGNAHSNEDVLGGLQGAGQSPAPGMAAGRSRASSVDATAPLVSGPFVRSPSAEYVPSFPQPAHATAAGAALPVQANALPVAPSYSAAPLYGGGTVPEGVESPAGTEPPGLLAVSER